MHQSYVVNSHYKFSIPIKQIDSDPELTDGEWIQLYNKLFGQKKMAIYFSQYEGNHLDTVLQNLVVADVEEIEVEYTGHGRILRQLAFPFFKELKRLMLGSNFICSVEFLAYIPAPNLQQVNLNENKIKSLLPLHKSVFTKLRSIDLRNNSILQLQGIQHLQISELVLQGIDYDRVMAYSIMPVFKLKTNQMKLIKLQGFQRISERGLTPGLKKRWPKIWIYQKKPSYF